MERTAGAAAGGDRAGVVAAALLLALCARGGARAGEFRARRVARIAIEFIFARTGLAAEAAGALLGGGGVAGEGGCELGEAEEPHDGEEEAGGLGRHFCTQLQGDDVRRAAPFRGTARHLLHRDARVVDAGTDEYLGLREPSCLSHRLQPETSAKAADPRLYE